jgi:RNA polymerase sigma-70 factor (ECF subfamily)
MDRDTTSMSDAALMMAVARYEEDAVRELYRRHGRSVFGLANRLLRDRAQAEEVLQDLFVRLWERPERFDPAKGALKSFLLRETHSRCVDRLRSDTARRRREDQDGIEQERVRHADDIEREVWELIRSERVKEALATLSELEREAIMLAYFGGYTYRDVAVMLDVAEGTIKSRIRAGLHKLADRLDAAGLGR